MDSTDISGTRCMLVSARYSPGLAKEVALIADQLAQRGAKIRLLLSREYATHRFPESAETSLLPPSSRYRHLLSAMVGASHRRKAREAFSEFKPHFVMVYNPHPANASILRLGKLQKPSTLTCMFLHTPFTSRKFAYGLRFVEFAAVDILQARALRFADIAVVLSRVALERFKAKFRSLKTEAHQCNIVIPDDPVASDRPERKYLSLIGHVNRATGLTEFLRLAEECQRRNLSYRFQIVTPSNIRRDQRWIAMKKLSNVRVQAGRILSDAEIDWGLRESLAVFRFGRDMTQSGVIPVAFKNATPVIAPNLPGYAQHIRDFVDGRLFPPNGPWDAVIECIDWVVKNPHAGIHARQAYVDNFSPQAWEGMYSWLLSKLARLREAECRE